MNNAEIQKLRDILNNEGRFRPGLPGEPGAWIKDETEDYILVEDFSDFRDVCFFFHPDNRKHLLNRIHIMPECRCPNAEKLADALLKAEKLQPGTLTTLRHVFVICENGEEETVADFLNRHAECEPGFEPDWSGPGVIWHWQSSIIINATCIEQCVEKLLCETGGDRDAEMQCGFWVTLFHELRHIDQQNPLFSEQIQDIEEDAEQWGRQMFETMILSRCF